MSRVFFILTLVLLAATTIALAGCGGGGSTSSPASSDSSAVGAQGREFGVTLTSGQQTYSAGQAIPMTLTVTNNSSAPAQVTLAGVGYDFEVLSGGSAVYQFSYGKATPDDIAEKTLAPGAQISYQLSWNQQDDNGAGVAPGTYTIIAWTTNGGVDQYGASDTMAAPALTVTVQ